MTARFLEPYDDMGTRRGGARRPPRPTTAGEPTRRPRRASEPTDAADDAGDRPDEKGERDSFSIVGVGASAGGLEALTRLLKALPTDTGMAFVLVQHLAPSHVSALSEILSRATRMPVMEVRDEPTVEPNHVYVIPPGQDMVISHGTLQLRPREDRGAHRPVDRFFRALAEDRGHQAIGVVLSGTATDGTIGLQAIKAEGGITFAQDDTAQHTGMPHSAIASGSVDFVLPPDEIAREIVRIGRHPYAVPEPQADEPNLSRILGLLHRGKGVDFTHYKFNTLYRRITRRMLLLRKEDLKEYASVLQQDPKEVEALYRDILISVTSFFRNPEAFEVLKEKVFPPLIKDRARHDPVRVWTLGCSTGQEAYSVAMAFAEFAEAAGSSVPIQLFATDLNDAGVETARAGIYSKDDVEDVSPERLRRFFVEKDGGYRISKSIRDSCVFSRHNVLADPPFSRIDLISCRNLLIYLEPVLQQKILPTLHYALKPAGFLWLGGSETIGSFRDLFEAEDVRHKIYSKKPGPPEGYRPVQRVGVARPAFIPIVPRPSAAGTDLHREADRLLLAKFAPPGVLVSADLDILQYRGDTGPYLAPAPGKASLNLLKMLRGGLLVSIRAAILRAGKEGAAVREEGLRVKSNGGDREVAVEVVPVKGSDDKASGGRDGGFLVLFDESGSARAAEAETGASLPASPETQWSDADNSRLEQELSATREYLQSMVEQQEAANEELQSANEEVQSANEELQSVNEELETSKEELQSSNEELATVNDELSNRNLELGRLNDDLTNLLDSVQMAIVMLGPDLRVRRFTPAAEKLLHLLPTDVGRPLGNIKLNVDGLSDLEPLLTEVLETSGVKEREVRDRLGRWYSLRLRPYRTLDNTIDGVVLSLVDVDLLKRAKEYMESIVETVREPLMVLDPELRVRTANRSFYQTFRTKPEETEGRLLHELGKGQWNIPELNRLLEQVLPRDSQFSDFLVKHEFEHIGEKTMLLNARQLLQIGERTPSMLLAIEDVTERYAAREAREEGYARLQRHAEQFQTLLYEAPLGVYLVDADLRIRHVNPTTFQVFNDVDVTGRDFDEVIHLLWPKAYADEIVQRFRHTLETGEPYFTRERSEERLDRRVTEIYEWQINRIPLPEGRYGVVCYFREVSDQVRSRQAIAESDRHKTEFLAMLAHELRNPMAPIRNAAQLLRLSGGNAEGIASASAIIERQVGQMVRLVDDLLDVGRISRGKIELRKERVELASVVYIAVEASRPAMEAAEQELTTTLPAKPVHLNADPVRLAQVVSNLLNNACRFTDKGGHIALTVELEGEEAVIRVRDTGIGIAADQIPRIFDKFMQVDTSMERSAPGFGIGLTLVKDLVEKHGGTVVAQSAGLLQGSEFVVRLPILVEPAGAPPPEPAVSPPAPATARRVLVVDDNRDSAMSLAMLLQLTGNETQTAYDGLEAVAAAAAFRPDVVLLDIGLPKLNGYEAARRIRELPWAKKVVLVAVTGWGQEEDRQKSREAGFDAHIVKPLDQAVLMTLLSSSSDVSAVPSDGEAEGSRGE